VDTGDLCERKSLKDAAVYKTLERRRRRRKEKKKERKGREKKRNKKRRKVGPRGHGYLNTVCLACARLWLMDIVGL
jgi:hypothetical protein